MICFTVLLYSCTKHYLEGSDITVALEENIVVPMQLVCFSLALKIQYLLNNHFTIVAIYFRNSHFYDNSYSCIHLSRGFICHWSMKYTKKIKRKKAKHTDTRFDSTSFCWCKRKDQPPSCSPISST